MLDADYIRYAFLGLFLIKKLLSKKKKKFFKIMANIAVLFKATILKTFLKLRFKTMSLSTISRKKLRKKNIMSTLVNYGKLVFLLMRTISLTLPKNLKVKYWTQQRKLSNTFLMSSLTNMFILSYNENR
jgi:hypothetical protein